MRMNVRRGYERINEKISEIRQIFLSKIKGKIVVDITIQDFC